MHGAEKYAMQPVSALPRVLRCSTANSPRAFTLTELLVVITIIAILTSLITVAAVSAMKRANQARITLEIQQLSSAIEQFRNDMGAYPPNGVSPTSMTNNAGILLVNINVADFNRMFNQAFPRHQEPDFLIAGLAGGAVGGGVGTGTAVLAQGMNGAEALVFWLGGFSKDPKYPISGPGGPSFENAVGVFEDLEGRNRTFEFDLGRLGPRDANGNFDTTVGRVIAYGVDFNNDGDTNDAGESRLINMWRYTPSGSVQPLAYFDASRHRAQVQTPANTFVVDYDPWFGQLSANITDSLFALKRLNETNLDRFEFVNQGKFQILHCGLDDVWGNFASAFSLVETSGNPILFPEGPFIGDIADTLSNFSTGTLEDEQE